MDALLERIRSLRAELDAVEQGLEAGPRPDALAWIELDTAGVVRAASPAALRQLGAAGQDLQGAPIGVVTDVDGDPLSDGLLVIATRAGRRQAISVGATDGRFVVLGGAAPPAPTGQGSAGSRKLVHDMSNVLGIMRGRAELVAMQNADEKVRSAMEEIQKAADRALEMMDAAIPR